MRIDILAIGSRGDVQPFVALGLGLRNAGHSVRLVTLGGFEEFVRSRGLDQLTIGRSPQEIAGSNAGREWVQQRKSVVGFFRGFTGVASSLIEEGIATYWKDLHYPEAVICSPMGILAGWHLAERLRVPLVQAQPAPPIFPTRYNHDGRTSLGIAAERAFTVFLDGAFRFLIWNKVRGATNAARAKTLGLPPLSRAPSLRSFNGQQVHVLGAYSEVVARKPPDWGKEIHVTGYWFLDEPREWSPPDSLRDFLRSGTAPLFVGFGSTPFPRPEETTKLIVRAVAGAAQRAVVVAGGSLETGRLSDEVLSLDSVPHSWLFPQVSAAVHHGGAGVTGAALRAGLPSVVVPIFGDQPFWGSRVFQLGAGPRPIPANRLTEAGLTAAIQATTHPDIREKAASLGRQIRQEDGVGRAVQIVNQLIRADASAPLKRLHTSAGK